MALPPQSGDTFLREVDENLRRDEFQGLVKKYSGWLIAALVLFLAGIGGWLYWQDRQRAKAAEHSEILAQTYSDAGARKLATVPQRLDTLASEGGDVVKATALFARAAVALDQNDRKLAVAKYRQIVDDDGLPDPYRDLAQLRSTMLEFDSLKPEEVIARLEPMAKSGQPWFGSAGELVAMAYLKQGKEELAGPLLAAVAKDDTVPQSLRSRTRQLAGLLGYDAVVDVDETLTQLQQERAAPGAAAPAGTPAAPAAAPADGAAQ